MTSEIIQLLEESKIGYIIGFGIGVLLVLAAMSVYDKVADRFRKEE